MTNYFKLAAEEAYQYSVCFVLWFQQVEGQNILFLHSHKQTAMNIAAAPPAPDPPTHKHTHTFNKLKMVLQEK